MGIERAFEMTNGSPGGPRRTMSSIWIMAAGSRCCQPSSLASTRLYDGHTTLRGKHRQTKQIVEICHEFGIPVEAELGRIPDAGEQVVDTTPMSRRRRSPGRQVSTPLPSLLASCAALPAASHYWTSRELKTPTRPASCASTVLGTRIR